MIAAFQTLALIAACCGLLGLWRAIPGSRLRAIAAAGFAVRALGAAAAFLISFFDLPFLDSLHFGDGFWFYAIDGIQYFDIASHAAAGGLDDIWLLDRHGPSVAYSQLFAAAILLFGRTPAAALFLNFAAYLGCAYLIGRWGATSANERGAALSLAAISFVPTWIVWSTQPLKDAVFVFLMVLYFYSLMLWRRFCADPRDERTALWSILLMVVAIYGLAGIRWYFAFVGWGASLLFFFHAAWIAKRRAVSVVIAIVPFVLAANVIVLAAGPYLNWTARAAILPFAPWSAAPLRAADVGAEVRGARRGFDVTAGSTKIIPGRGGSVVAGAAAALLPRDVANATGLVQIRGEGRGLWRLADVDTLFCDAILIVAIAALIARWRSVADPTVVHLIVVTVAVAGLLVYVVTNFGALIRLREMIVACLALIPLAVGSAGNGSRA